MGPAALARAGWGLRLSPRAIVLTRWHSESIRHGHGATVMMEAVPA